MPAPTLSNKLLRGRSFRSALVRAAGGDRGNVRRIVVEWGPPDPDRGVRVSYKRGPFPVYAAYDHATGTVTLTSEADLLLVNEDASEMFKGFCNMRELSADRLDTSLVTDMSHMFQGCSGARFNPDVSRWDVGRVTDTWGMFSGCSGASFNPDVSRWDVDSALLAMAYLR